MPGPNELLLRTLSTAIGASDVHFMARQAMPVRLVATGAGTQVIGQHPDAQGSFGELLVVSELLARVVPDGVPTDAVAVVDAFAVGEFYVGSSKITGGRSRS